jgi:membrane fusion protein, multidrug efflux system
MDERIDPGRPSSGQREIIPEQVDRANLKTGSDNRKLYQKKRVIIPLLILILIAAAIVAYWNTYLRGYTSTDDAFIDSDNVTISSKVLGRILELKADEGDTIKKGDTIVRLDDSDLRAQEAQAEASLIYAQKNAALAKVNLQKTQDDFNRTAEQFKGNAVTREQYDHARQAEETAQAQYDAVLSQIGTAHAQLGVVQTQLNNMGIMAPFTGVVARRWLLAGDVVQAAQPILTVYSLENAWVTAYLEETKIRSIRLGDPVEISVDAYPGQTFQGKIADIGATAASQFSLIPPNNASGNFTKITQRISVKIAINQSLRNPAALRPGMSVVVKIKVREE